MKIGLLTSSRADFGIYHSLIERFKLNDRISIEIIAFGMHLSQQQGETINQVLNTGIKTIHKLGRITDKNEVKDIIENYGDLVKIFGQFWETHKYDLVFALGDRWELSAAIQASIPFEVKIAHIHGGETTLGAIDNIYRHQISLASKFHFTSTERYSERVEQIIGSKDYILNVGSLSLEGLEDLELPSWFQVKRQFQIPFNHFILITFHPETVENDKNIKHLKELEILIRNLVKEHNLLITKANLDSSGFLYNQLFSEMELKFPERIKVISAFGKLNYFKAMEISSLILGNSSSGIIEAASFKKWVVNVGARQNGRIQNSNVVNSTFDANSILMAVKAVLNKDIYTGENLYYKSNPSEIILNYILNPSYE